ncbi:alanine racemase [Psychromicrobium sp. YIM B11713]|uniref:alanine racemase n=1 Tax=Psychromicrobium sp. YIM B11713 TaxID=3145233 RepID=UPI00374E5CDB
MSGSAIDASSVAALNRRKLDWRFKAVPAAVKGCTPHDFLAYGPELKDLQTPLLTLDGQALETNLDRMARWCEEHGVQLAPHGKTTMAPQLWQRQLERGAWGITLANLAQLRVAAEFGVASMMLANSLTDPQAIRWVAEQGRSGTRIVSWVDNVQTVERIEKTLENSEAVLDVLVELGGPGGRTGARGIVPALEVCRSVAASERLRLIGVSGYEGSLAHTADQAALETVRGYLSSMKELHLRLTAEGLYAEGPVILSAGGSAYFDAVVEVLADCAGPEVIVLLRSGAYLVHDDGFYARISPFSRSGDQPLVAGMHGWARVVSQPEPGLAILDAGKRDLPFDEGLPIPQGLADELGAALLPLEGARITAMNDQHCYLSFDAAQQEVRIGQVIRLGLSHPCTAFDKWQLIPVLDTVDSGNVIDLIHTFF